MWQDPIVKETRALREQYVSKFKHDADAIFEDILKRQEKSRYSGDSIHIDWQRLKLSVNQAIMARIARVIAEGMPPHHMHSTEKQTSTNILFRG
jgi:hypothetical protein